MAEAFDFHGVRVNLIGPDELAFLARFAIKHALASDTDAPAVRRQLRNILPILRMEQRAVLLEAIPSGLRPEWDDLRSEIVNN